MDPNATLTELRAALAEMASEEGRQDLGTFLAGAERLEEAARALDEWLSKGGFLPTAWTPRNPGPATFNELLDSPELAEMLDGYDGTA